jgi:hypothetical protein
MKLKAPVELLMENWARSAPPLIEYIKVVLASGSDAVTVPTAVEFVLTDTRVVAPPPLDVIDGASF